MQTYTYTTCSSGIDVEHNGLYNFLACKRFQAVQDHLYYNRDTCADECTGTHALPAAIGNIATISMRTAHDAQRHGAHG